MISPGAVMWWKSESDGIATGTEGEAAFDVVEPETTWDPWFQIRPERVFDHTAQQVTAVARNDHHVDLFVIGFDNAVWSCWWDSDGGDWRPWFQIRPERTAGGDDPDQSGGRRLAHGRRRAAGTRRASRPPPADSRTPKGSLARRRRFSLQQHHVRPRAQRRGGETRPAQPREGQPMWRQLIYAMQDDGQLLWHRHDTKTGDVEGPNAIAEGWNFKQVFAADDGIIYAVQDDGHLLWFRHDGRVDGTFALSGPKTVGVGWDVKHVFAAADGIIYAVQHDGHLLWWRHDGRVDGTFTWTGPHTVGVGWDVKHVFAGTDGLIYMVRVDGEMLWFRHDGRGDGSFRWTGPNPVGAGWGFRQVFSGGPASI
jgi:hypothetical protein